MTYVQQMKGIEVSIQDVEENAEQYCEIGRYAKVKEETPSKTDATEDLKGEIARMEKEIKMSLKKLEDAKSRLLGAPKESTPARDLQGSYITKKPPAPFKEEYVERYERKLEPEDKIAQLLLQALENRSAEADLPRVELDVFDGDHLEFPAWWSAFEVAVDSKPIPERRKLCYLKQYTSDRARKAIKGFLQPIGREESYQEAKTILLSRYGDPMRVSEAFKKKLNDWPRIPDGDGEALTELSDFMWQCHSAMQSVSYMSNLDSPEENARLAAKLPTQLSSKWASLVDKKMYSYDEKSALNVSVLTGSYPSFLQFCQFVSEQARIATGPCRRYIEEFRAAGKKDTARAASFQTSNTEVRPRANTMPADTRRPRCSFCQEEHYLYLCTKFLGNSRDFKLKYARDRGLCFDCLRRGHRAVDCTIKNKSLMRDPEGLRPTAPEFVPASTAATSTEYANVHSTSGRERAPVTRTRILNKDLFEQKMPTSSQEEAATVVPEKEEAYCSVQGRSEEDQHYTMILPVWVKAANGKDSTLLTYAAIDTQSDCSFITTELANKIQVEKKEITLSLETMGVRTVGRSYRTKEIAVRGELESASFVLKKCYTKDHIPVNRDAILCPSAVKEWPHLEDLSSLPRKREDMPIGMLIGYDCPDAMVSREIRSAEDCSLYGIRTCFGWTFVGSNQERAGEVNYHCCHKTQAREVTHEDIVSAFGLDFVETGKPHHKMSGDDLKFMKIMQEGIEQLGDRHFQLPLPMRYIPRDLPDSRPYARKCLESVRRRMKRDENYAKMYRDFMYNLILTGQIELVENPDEADVGSTWYWSHHGVSHPCKPGCLRCVFNGSAKIQGIALNDLLLPGPDQINNLVGVLLRFRAHTVPVTCDVEGMFLQVWVQPFFRDYLRLFWFRDGDPDGEVLVYRMKVHLFGASSSPGCANFALKETANRFEHIHGKLAADFVRRNFYVDDGLGGAPDGPAAKELMISSHELCGEGGFNLRKFTCGDQKALSEMPAELVAQNKSDLTIGEMAPGRGLNKSLGVNLCLDTDRFVFNFELKEALATRRSLLSCLSSLYDPMGLVAPALLKGRVFLQRLCERKFEWDAELPDELMETWNDWYKQIKEMKPIYVQRRVRRNAMGQLVKQELHVFSDASNDGHGACCYLLFEDVEGNVDVSLILGKARVNPVKATTVPRLELQAAVLGVKLSLFIQEEWEMEFTAIYYWCDSSPVLGYISNEHRKFYLYVSNRASFIREHTKIAQWRYIQTANNPADLASRGLGVEELASHELWWNGPPEMLQAAELPIARVDVRVDDPELKKEKKVLATVVQPKPWVLSVVEKYSSWTKMISVVKNVLAFLDKCRGLEESSVTTRKRAETLILAAVQKYYLAGDYQYYWNREVEIDEDGVVHTCGKIKVKESAVSELDPYIDRDQIMKVGGRFKRSDLHAGVRHPVILPPHSTVTRAIVEHYHRATQHQGPNWTLSRIRQGGFWIIRGRQIVASQVRRCPRCIRARGKPVQPRMSELPAERMTVAPPFTYTGVDVFGPFLVKQARSSRKRWCCIFVCLTSRAIHLELLETLDTSGFINAYRRFNGRRGPVRALYSDKGTNFVGGHNEIQAQKNELDEEELKRALELKGCDWLDMHFNVPKASNMAGAWERMIGTVRAAMFQTLTQHGENLTDETLRTLLVESESIVNSRPIAYLSSDVSDDPIPLSPSTLLTLKQDVVAPLPGKFDALDRYAKARWKYVQYLAQYFWDRWRNEVLPTQTTRKKWKQEGAQLQVGDVVIMVDETVERRRWPLARVTEVSPGADGRVRKVTVRARGSTYDRPANKLILVMNSTDDTAPP